MHLFEQASNNPHRSEPYIRKLEAGDGPAFTLIRRIRSRVNRADFPIVVSEGGSVEKSDKIDGNAYLKKARERFREALKDEEAAFFVYWHGLNRVDSHIIKEITDGRVGRVYLGWYFPEESERFAKLAQWWRDGRAKAGGPGIEVRLFDVKSVPVWKMPAPAGPALPSAPIPPRTP